MITDTIAKTLPKLGVCSPGGFTLMGQMLKILLFKVQLKMKEAIEKLLKIQIMPTYRHGHYDCFDLKKSGYPIALIFDVGANIGQSAAKFEVAFPKAKIHCFEPVKGVFESLKQNTQGNPNITCYNFALGSQPGIAPIYLTEPSVMSSFIEPTIALQTGTDYVEIQTVDDFCARHQVERIDLLKIDAEGFDFEVLLGARDMLLAKRIAFVLIEVGFYSGSKSHVFLDEVRSLLTPMGYEIFGIYDQKLEWSGNQEKRLRYANVCFLNEASFDRK